MTTTRRHLATLIVLVCLGVLATSSTVVAQLDPLQFVRRLPPNVILVVDTSLSMLENGDGRYYDPVTYTVASDPVAASVLGVSSGAQEYRRIYVGLELRHPPNSKYRTSAIDTVDDTDPDFTRFWDETRLQIAKDGIVRAVTENRDIGERWALVGLRQQDAAWRTPPSCDSPVRLRGWPPLSPGDTTPCHAGAGQFAIYPPTVTVPNYSLQAANGTRLPFGGTDSADVVDIVDRPILDPFGLIPAGVDTPDFVDRPLAFALSDALAETTTAMASDPAGVDCRNTVVVLLTSGGDSGDPAYESAEDVDGLAQAFGSVSVGGRSRRAPIYVAHLRPDGGEISLRRIAGRSGGRYFQVEDAADVARVINTAIQAAHATPTDFDQGLASEYQTVSPIVGTVNLSGARSSTGASLPNSSIQNELGRTITQLGTMTVSAGIELNGHGDGSLVGVLRAFRTFRPVADPTTRSGFTFVADGTPLWPDLDGRPETAGRARTPADPAARNVFTYVPGRGVLPFHSDEATTLGPHLGTSDPERVIDFIRTLPIGPVIGSTPALMEPPRLSHHVSPDYTTHAEALQDRRAIIWVGGNNGMLHAIDARTGVEVWAFVPYNLLPKLRTLVDGQALERFDYFVDSSPKIAEVELDGAWRTVLVVGQAYGGTFYQAFDITAAGTGGPGPDSDDDTGVLASFDDPDHVPLLWSFPRYDVFDPTVDRTLPLTDGFPGSELRVFGDLQSGATPAEKSVGFTWSVPVVGQLGDGRAVAVTGSGYFPGVEALLPGRGPGAPAAGRSLYVIDLETGDLVGGSSACGGSGSSGCVDIGDDGSNGRKNALQADPAASGSAFPPGPLEHVYAGDIDGHYRRFDLATDGRITVQPLVDTSRPLYAASSVVGGPHDTYMFFATGSEALPLTTSGGTLATRAFGLRDNVAGGASQTFAVDLAEGSLLERVSSAPVVAGDAVFFTTVLEDPTSPCVDFRSKLYAMSFLGGAAYDTNGDGALTTADNTVIATVAGRATAPFVADGHLFFGTSGQDGSSLEMFGDPERFNHGVNQSGLRLLSWRETE